MIAEDLAFGINEIAELDLTARTASYEIRRGYILDKSDVLAVGRGCRGETKLFGKRTDFGLRHSGKREEKA